MLWKIMDYVGFAGLAACLVVDAAYLVHVFPDLPRVALIALLAVVAAVAIRKIWTAIHWRRINRQLAELEKQEPTRGDNMDEQQPVQLTDLDRQILKAMRDAVFEAKKGGRAQVVVAPFTATAIASAVGSYESVEPSLARLAAVGLVYKCGDAGWMVNEGRLPGIPGMKF
jgi:hypothetical protein